MFNNYKNCLLNNEIILKSQERNTEEINKIAQSSIDGKRSQTYRNHISY